MFFNDATKKIRLRPPSLIAAACAWILLGALPLHAKVFFTQEEALKLAFGDEARVERRTVFLTDEQKKTVEGRARSRFESTLVTYYAGKKDGRLIGYAFFDTHMVRTMPETLLVAVTPEGRIHFVEILEFSEPDEYRPSERWLALLKDKSLDDNLWVKRGVRNITGSTLSAQSITDSIRRWLGFYHVIVQSESEDAR